MRAILTLLSLAFVAAHSAPASAQTELRPGVAVQGARAQAQEVQWRGRGGSGAYSAVCYLLDTTPGSVWRVEARTPHGFYLWVGAGEECDAFERDRYSNGGRGWTQPNVDMRHDYENGENRREARFTAGGGAYWIQVQVGSADNNAFTLTATQIGTNGRNPLPPGIDISPFRSTGTASTASSTQPVSDARPGQALRDCDTCPSLVVIPAGSFMMGSPATEAGRNNNEGPRHVVTIGRAFALGQHEVTFDEYDACVAANACTQLNDQDWGRGRRPVVNVRYGDALRYVHWLSQTTGQRYFLPSEAEWEYAARAGTDTAWNTGSAIISDDANIMNTFGRTTPVGGYPPNAFGLHDMHGNVAEWTQDCADVGYHGAPTDGSAAALGNCATSRVLRGGDYRSLPNDARSARRQLQNDASHPAGRGFRVARAL